MSTENHEEQGAQVAPRPDPEVLDAELVEDAQLVPDAPAPVTPAWQAGEPVRHPVIAPWLVDRGQRGQAARWALGFVRHWALFHLARLPIYVLKLIGYSPIGATCSAAWPGGSLMRKRVRCGPPRCAMSCSASTTGCRASATSAATATGFPTATVAVLALGWTVNYLIACAWWPYRACWRCHGAGKLRSPSGKAWRQCPRCKASGACIRIGRRIFEACGASGDRRRTAQLAGEVAPSQSPRAAGPAPPDNRSRYGAAHHTEGSG